MAKIGELFVDLGVNSGNALNALTNFSIKFLALKNAAQQFGGILDNLFGDVARYGQGLYQTSRNLNLSTKWLQEMKIRAEQTGGSLEEVVGAVRHIMQENANIMMGQGNIDPYQILNIDMSKLRSPVKVLEEVMGKVSRLQAGFREIILNKLGIPLSVWNAYSAKIVEIDDKLKLTEDEVRDLDNLRKEYVALRQTFSMGWDKLIAGNATTIKKVIDWLKDLSKELFKFLQLVIDVAKDSKSFDDFINKLSKGLKDQAKTAREFAEAIMAIADAIVYLTEKGKKVSSFINGISAAWKGLRGERNESVPEDKRFKGSFTEYLQLDKEGKLDENGNIIEIDSSPQSITGDYFKNMTPLPSYAGGGFSYVDNSQTTIITPDGPEEYTKILNGKADKFQSQIGTLEMQGVRE